MIHKFKLQHCNAALTFCELMAAPRRRHSFAMRLLPFWHAMWNRVLPLASLKSMGIIKSGPNSSCTHTTDERYCYNRSQSINQSIDMSIAQSGQTSSISLYLPWRHKLNNCSSCSCSFVRFAFAAVATASAAEMHMNGASPKQQHATATCNRRHTHLQTRPVLSPPPQRYLHPQRLTPAP